MPARPRAASAISAASWARSSASCPRSTAPTRPTSMPTPASTTASNCRTRSRGCLARSTCSSSRRSPGVSGRGTVPWPTRATAADGRRTGWPAPSARRATWARCRAWAAGGLDPAAVAGLSGQRQHPQLLHPAGRQPGPTCRRWPPQADVLRRQLNPELFGSPTGSTPPPAPTPPATARLQRPAAGVGKAGHGRTADRRRPDARAAAHRPTAGPRRQRGAGLGGQNSAPPRCSTSTAPGRPGSTGPATSPARWTPAASPSGPRRSNRGRASTTTISTSG